MSGLAPEEHVGLPALRQTWTDAVFLHWPVPADAITTQLPDGLRVDLVGERAWVTVTTFMVRDVRGPFGPTLPIPAFGETNVRTYVVGPDGRDGIWFLSIDAASIATVLGARVLAGAPYHRARVVVERRRGEVFRYESARWGSPSVRHCVEVARQADAHDARVDDVDAHLVGRWRAWTLVGGRLAVTSVEHEPWQLEPVDVVRSEVPLLGANKLPVDANAVPPRAQRARAAVRARLTVPRWVAARASASAVPAAR